MPSRTEPELERILAAYGRFVRSSLRRLMPRDLALSVEDLEQEVRIRLWRALEAEREIERPASYLYRVAATVTVDAIRRARARRQDLSEPLAAPGERDSGRHGAPEPATGREESVERIVALDEMRGKIHAARARLSESRSRAVGLHLQGFSTDEIASTLGWSEPRARNLVYRGMKDLRTHLRSEGVLVEDD